MTDIYLHIVARMADYMAMHPYLNWASFSILLTLIIAQGAWMLAP